MPFCWNDNFSRLCCFQLKELGFCQASCDGSAASKGRYCQCERPGKFEKTGLVANTVLQPAGWGEKGCAAHALWPAATGLSEACFEARRFVYGRTTRFGLRRYLRAPLRGISSVHFITLQKTLKASSLRLLVPVLFIHVTQFFRQLSAG